MKKQSVAKIILIYFFKTIGVLALLVGVGVLSYYLTMLYFKQTDKQERSTTYTHVIPVNAGTESSNMIYSYDENNGAIKAMMLELFDQNTRNMSYVTIPINTQVTISQTLYQELVAINASIPQVMRLTDIQTYFTGDVAYEYGIKILQDTLPVEIGYFTAMPSNKFDVYYEYGTGREGCYSPTLAFITSMKKCTTKSDMDDMLTDLWDEQISDITLSQKLNYSESLAKVNWDFVHVYCLKGVDDGTVFTINARKSKRLISDIWECEAYSQAQYETAVPDSTTSEEQNIEILNGSAIDGLASRYQKAMQADGLSVVNIGNYTGIKQETTTIYAKNVKWAKKNLRSYFPHPKKVAVEKATEMEEGIDVQIILGVDSDE